MKNFKLIVTTLELSLAGKEPVLTMDNESRSPVCIDFHEDGEQKIRFDVLPQNEGGDEIMIRFKNETTWQGSIERLQSILENDVFG